MAIPSRLEALRDTSDMAELVTKVKGDLDVDDWVVQAYVMNVAANVPPSTIIADGPSRNESKLPSFNITAATIPAIPSRNPKKVAISINCSLSETAVDIKN